MIGELIRQGKAAAYCVNARPPTGGWVAWTTDAIAGPVLVHEVIWWIPEYRLADFGLFASPVAIRESGGPYTERRPNAEWILDFDLLQTIVPPPYIFEASGFEARPRVSVLRVIPWQVVHLGLYAVMWDPWQVQTLQAVFSVVFPERREVGGLWVPDVERIRAVLEHPAVKSFARVNPQGAAAIGKRAEEMAREYAKFYH